jgi:outer membrane protein
MILAAAAVLALGSLNLNAQAPGSQIVFVDSQAAINAHPAGKAAREVEERGRAELDEIKRDIEVIAQRARAGEQIGPAEQELYQTLLTTHDARMNHYISEAGAAAQPAVEAIDRILTALSAEFGYTLVLDQTVAAGSGLVVYAAEGLDITQQVIDRVNSGQ